jgi:acetyl-CoA C-acetyltransferase
MTGGPPFFGGPGNNYSMHAIAETLQRAREVPVVRLRGPTVG